MNTTATTASPTFTQTAKERRTEILAIRDKHNLSMVPVVGNTWPLKGVLYALGSMWDKERKVLTVPTNSYKEAQGIIDSYAAQHPKGSKAKPVDNTPTVFITTEQVKAAAQPEAKPETVTYSQPDGSKVIHEKITTPAKAPKGAVDKAKAEALKRLDTLGVMIAGTARKLGETGNPVAASTLEKDGAALVALIKESIAA